jgi:polyhydroxyalkanoate synthesis regulator phasin
MKQTLKIGVTILVVASLAMSGIALAQVDESTDQAAQNAVTRIAEKLQPLVDDGTITADQAEAVAEVLADGFRPGGRRGDRRPNFGAIVEFLGMEGDEFRQALQEYDTLADLAAANGSSGSELIAFLVGQVGQRLDQAVADGKLSQAEADEKLAGLTDKITGMVSSEFPEDAGQRRRHRRGHDGPNASGDQSSIEGAALSA